jgi:acyl-homoserine-lactone acylase
MFKRFLFLLLCLCPVLTVQAQVPYQAEIIWDEWGVPHIFAPTNPTLFYAYGWAQATNHADVLLRLYAEARGEAAQYGGEDYLESDIQVRQLGIPAEGIANYDGMTLEWQEYLDDFAEGFSDYVWQNAHLIDDVWEKVAPIRGIDILRLGTRNLRYSFTAGRGLRAAQQWLNGTLPPPEPENGSNAWAIAPSRSASGSAMLVANPHQPWVDAGLWMEAHFITPDLNLYGATIIGGPVINIGFTEHHGWTHTVNTHDGWDLYELTLSDDGSGYLYDGEVLPFETSEEIIRVKNDDDTFEEVTITVKRSVHGAVLAERPEDSKALALRVVGENTGLAIQQWWEMGNAKNLQDFEAALSNIRIPMFTIMYADKAGNILHVFNEQIPVREAGDWAFWNNTTPVDSRNPAILPGDTSELVWTKLHPYSDLPKVLNPESGWLQNANESPWTTTLPLALNPADYPPYFAPPPFVWPRPQTSMRLLHEDASITYDELIDYKFSTFMELTNAVLEDLIAAAQASDNETAQKAAEILAAWDRRADKDSVGAALFTAWALDYVQRIGYAAFAIQWDIADPLNTPRGLADPEGAVQSLITVANQLELLRALGGGMDVKYGDAFRLRYRDSGVDLPASGGFDVVGTFSILTFVQDNDLRFYPVHGDSFIAVLEFGTPLQAKVLLTYGNATQPGSPHVGDQLALFSDQQLRDALMTRDAIEMHMNRSEMLPSY